MDGGCCTSAYNGATILPALAKLQGTIFSMFCWLQQNIFTDAQITKETPRKARLL